MIRNRIFKEPVDFFTYNSRIADYLSSKLDVKPRIDNSESDAPPLYCFHSVALSSVNFSEIDKLIGTTREGDMGFCGGYEIREPKTGKFLLVKQSLTEILARTCLEGN